MFTSFSPHDKFLASQLQSTEIFDTPREQHTSVDVFVDSQSCNLLTEQQIC